MSAMMASSAPGPVPVPLNPAGRGHSRQPSSSQRPPQQGEPPINRRPVPTAGAPNAEDNIAPLRPGGRQARPTAGDASQQRVHAPATGQARPTTSYVSQAAAKQAAQPAGAQQRQSSVRQPSNRPADATRPRATSNAPEPAPGTQPAAAAGGEPAAQEGQQQQQQGSRASSFPHAFERWEMLSSRWEGLTGYWVSRLEQNRHELSHLPLEQEMSRQITDLAAAGANLFQALIELQRLRASSERKFQRWFVETRADQERSREMSSELERSLRVERQKRADAVTTIQRLEKEKATSDKLLDEASRELAISKEECRRAWEELGRREQEERERTNSLREGHPTLVGGVQVTPMPMPGVPARRDSSSGSRPRTSYVPEAYPEHQNEYGDYLDHRQQPQQPQQPAAASSSQQQPGQPLHHEPDVASLPAVSATATATSSAQSPSQFYAQPPSDIHGTTGSATGPASNPSPVSYGANRNIRSPSASSVQSSDGGEAWQLDDNGDVIIDPSTNMPLPASVRRRQQRRGERAAAAAGLHGVPEGEERAWGDYPSYEGDEYDSNGDAREGLGSVAGMSGSSGSGGVGIGSGWEGVPRHHHPTRLSDVLEEEERTTLSEGRRSR